MRFSDDEIIFHLEDVVPVNIHDHEKMTDAEINQLTKGKYADLRSGTVNKECMANCLQVFEPQEEVIKLPCFKSHIFHTACLTPWLKAHSTCPICR